MIPLRLHIKNFLSYGSPAQVINFEPYHLICLSGKNGHGKSALLDAITWSLWGQARKAMSATRSDTNLLRLGTTNMVVALDFICNSHTYRVRREYNNEPGKNMTYLDFGIYDLQTGQWRQLTAKSIRETQDLIISIIGLDAEAFENSVFLRQGHSDEFSRKSPKDRKEMLANIIGLGIYELLRKKSIEKGREESIRHQNSIRTCDILKQAIAPQSTVLQELTAVEKTYTEIDIIDQEYAQQSKAIHEELQKLYAERQSLETLLAVVAHVDTQIQHDTHELLDLWNQWRLIRKQHQSLQHKASSKQRREDIMHQLAIVQDQLQKKVILSTTITELKETIRLRKLKQQQEHDNELKELIQQNHLYEQQKNIVSHDEQRLRTAYHEATALLYKLEQEEKAFGIIEDIASLEHEILQIEKQYEHIQTRLQHGFALQHRIERDSERILQEHIKLQDLHNSTCPVCLQNIQAKHKIKIVTLREQQLSRYSHQKKRLKQIIVHCQNHTKQLQEKIKNLRNRYKYTMHIQSSYIACCTQKEQSKQQVCILEQKMRDLQSAQELLDTTGDSIKKQITITRKRQSDEQSHDNIVQELENKLIECEQKLQETSHAHDQYNELQKELTVLAEEDIARAHVMQEINLQSERKQQIKQRCKNLRDLKYKQRERLHVHNHHSTIQKQINSKEQSARTLQEKRHKLVHEKEHLASQKGALEQTIRHINQQKTLLEQERKQLKILEDDITDYTMLAQVLSKDGIQGMLIEHILPEIEHEANLLLARLTDNQAQLQFESLRGLKNGALKETLEIKISDSLGTRPYELFSGGEAFRIDFALRLAISKLLARRAGASVQTLIIDEGFGSQDEEGLHYIMESLYAIQHEFAKIIIVSHLPTMKDQFPTHFYIHKGMLGSTVHLIQQG